MEEVKCQRCKQREAVFQCSNCEMFSLFCRYCDSYVHGLPSKKNHIKKPIEVILKVGLEHVPREKEKEIRVKDEDGKGQGVGFVHGHNQNQSFQNQKGLSKGKSQIIKSNTQSVNKYNNINNSINTLSSYQNLNSATSNKSNLAYQNNQTNQSQEYMQSAYSNFKPIKGQYDSTKILNTDNQNRILDSYNNISKSKIFTNLNTKQSVSGGGRSQAQSNKNSMLFDSKQNDQEERDKEKNLIMEYYLKNNDNNQNSIEYNEYDQDQINNYNKFNDRNDHSNNNNNDNNENNEYNEINNNNSDNFKQHSQAIKQDDTENKQKIYFHSSYSKEYVNELRSIFLKEKNELIFKNNSMQNTLDKVKNSFSEQINQMTSQIEDANRKHQFSLKALEENIDSYYKTIILQKDSLIEEQQNKINSLLISNKSLSERFNSSQINLEDLESKLNNLDNYMQNLLTEKDNQINMLKKDLDNQAQLFQLNLDSFKSKTQSHYDKEMNQMIEAFEEQKAGLLNELNTVKQELSLRKEALSEIDSKYKETIDALQNEISCHKQNLMCYRDRRVELENELNNYKELLGISKKEIKLKSSEIKLLESNFEGVQNENDELKSQLTKLDKLVYGKVRQKFKN